MADGNRALVCPWLRLICPLLPGRVSPHHAVGLWGGRQAKARSPSGFLRLGPLALSFILQRPRGEPSVERALGAQSGLYAAGFSMFPSTDRSAGVRSEGSEPQILILHQIFKLIHSTGIHRAEHSSTRDTAVSKVDRAHSPLGLS